LKFLRQILRARWHQHITNSEILSHGGVGPLAEQIARRRAAAFCHIARLADNVPARLAVRLRSMHLLAVFPVNIGNVVLVAQGADGWNLFGKTLTISLPICREGPFFVVIVLERCYGPRRLRGPDDTGTLMLYWSATVSSC